MTPRPGAYLDRDGTINIDTIHVADASTVELIPGAAAAIRRLNDAGVPVVVVTNQSGIARGYFTEQHFNEVNARVAELLATEGAHFDGLYFCPHQPEITGPCECRKPGLKNYQLGAAAFDIDPSRSLFVGDRITDVIPSTSFGGFGVLVPSQHTVDADKARAATEFQLMHSLGDAVDAFLALHVTPSAP
jgi:histidinol-phosphate phosphatase family protein